MTSSELNHQPPDTTECPYKEKVSSSSNNNGGDVSVSFFDMKVLLLVSIVLFVFGDTFNFLLCNYITNVHIILLIIRL